MKINKVLKEAYFKVLTEEVINKDEISKKLDEFNIKNYTINKDSSIDVNGNVDLCDKNLTEIPFNFNKVNSNFNCSWNKLKTLKGSPKEVNNNFICANNKLVSLEGILKKIGGDFNCWQNLNLKDIHQIFKVDIKGKVLLDEKWDDSPIFKKYLAMKEL